jgi:uroporphyrinogen-III decarboxylase
MKIEKDVRSLMKYYERLYAASESRIRKSLKNVTDALHGKKVDDTPVMQVSQTILYPRHEIFFSREKNLVFQLANIDLTLQHETDYVPYLDPFEGVTIISEAFGCRVEVPVNGDPWIRYPLIKNHPEDVYRLQKPKPENDVYARTLDTLRYFEEKTGCLIPVGSTDPQGPLDIASLIWNNHDFLQACVLHKKEAHHLLNLVTEAFIEFYARQYDSLKRPAYPVHSFHLVDAEDGISVSDDEAVLLSPELYEEFGVPYLTRISEAFGGLYYHCCGDYGHLLDKILNIRDLRAVNGHLSPKELKPEYIKKITGTGVGLFLGLSDREIGWEEPHRDPEAVFDLYDSYYAPSVMEGSGGKGVVLVGYGGYMGYMDTRDGRGGDDFMVGVGGHVVEKSPLVDVPVENKNQNFQHIKELIRKLSSDHKEE